MGCKGSKPKASTPDAQKPPEQEKEPEVKQCAPAAEPAKPAPAADSGTGKANKLQQGDMVMVAQDGGIEGEVVRCTTTDVLVKTNDTTRWCEIEDVLQWPSLPPLATQVKVGETVTTADGAVGTVKKRTTTDVCLQLDDGKGKEEKWYGIDDITVVKVTIVGAQGLRNADWVGKSDPYCVCQLADKPSSKVQTPCIKNCLDPMWYFQAKLVGYSAGDPLVFELWDRDRFASSDDFLGMAMLTSDQFHSSSFYGAVALYEKSGELAKGGLTLRVEVEAAPPLPENIPIQDETVDAVTYDPGPEIAEVRPSGSGWCC